MKSNKIFLLITALFVLVVAVPVTATAQEEGWEFNLELYLWAASVGGNTVSGRDINVDFNDLMKDLKLGFMGAFGVRKGKWSLMSDLIYLDVEDDTTVDPGVSLSAELTAWIVTPVVGYSVVEAEKASLNIVGGVRYLNLGTNLGLGSLRVDDSGSFWNGIVGVKGQVNLSEKWYIPYYGDVGTGDSDLTWQATAGIAYKINWAHVMATYRYLDWDFDDSWDFDDRAVISDLNFNGPLFGVKFVF